MNNPETDGLPAGLWRDGEGNVYDSTDNNTVMEKCEKCGEYCLPEDTSNGTLCPECQPESNPDLSTRCHGTGTLTCHCGGDFCFCGDDGAECYGCPDCEGRDDDDDFYPTCHHCGRDECFNDRCLDEHRHPIYQNGPTR